MAGNYRRTNVPRRNSNWLGQFLLVFVVFVAGYMTASLYNLASLSAWVGTHVLANSSLQPIIKSGPQLAALPKPKFEFYTLLANEQVAGATQAATLPQAPVISPTMAFASVSDLPLHEPLAPVAAEKKPVLVSNSKDINSKDAYLVQVASFKSLREAERMRVGLVMKGFEVKIAMVNQQQINWYRVIIGPFGSKTLAQQAQQAFARREHIMGMIRKMDA